MTTPSNRLPVLFLLALLGVLAVVGVGIGELAGWVFAAAYAVLVVVALAAGAWRFRPAPPVRDHTGCSCCSGEPFRGVEIV